jgi:tryptophanyl-tRNA synthetase
MLTPVPWLERNPTYKDQILAQNNANMNNYGFLGYPILQAADIVIYKADRVPVGEDQLPHVELTREIVRRFNNLFGETFPEPQGLLTKCPRIPGTDGRKMSKSLNNAIFTDDDSETITKKVKMLITDPRKIRLGDKGHPDVCDCFALHLAFGNEKQAAVIREGCENGKLGCVDCKKDLAARVNAFLDPYREKKKKLTADTGYVNDVINEGNRKAREQASRTLAEVYEKTGLAFHGL